MKFIALVIATALTLSAPVNSQDLKDGEEIYFPSNIPCTTAKTAMEAIKIYNETAFAQGAGTMYGAKEKEYHEGHVKVWLSDSGSFTITIEMDDNVVCLITSGVGFEPIISTSLMN